MNELEIQRCMSKWAKHATQAGAPILRNIAFSSKATNYSPEMREGAKRLLATIQAPPAAPVAPPAAPITQATESPAAASETLVPAVVGVEASDASGTILEPQEASQD
jgi:hypothetical protein